MSNLDEAIKILKSGGIVIYPTDTAFGIGCRIDNTQSVAKLFRIRKRPSSQATPVLVSSIEMAEKYFLSPIDDNVRQVIKTYWPGALTVVYKCKKDIIPPLVRGSGETVGLRMPDHEVALKLIKAVGVPILGPSANFHGQATPFTYDQLDKDLMKLADYVVDGKCHLREPSTVLDCTADPFKIIRQGAVVVSKKPVILYIDTSDSKKIEAAVFLDGKKISKTAENNWTSQMLLPLIDQILKDNKLKITDLTEIKVQAGPGSYTGLRLGAAVANTLSYLLKIPVNGKKNKLVIPKYL